MNGRVFDANLTALAERQPAFAERLRRTRGDTRLVAGTARDGTPILRARLPRGERGLHSMYDPKREAERRIAGTEDSATLVLFGAGAMIDARCALDRNRSQAVVAADLGPSVWRSILEIVPIDDLLATGRLVCADDETTLEDAIHRVHQAAIRDGLVVRELRPWTEEPDHMALFSTFRRTLTRTLEAQAADLSAYRRFGMRWFINMFRSTLGNTREDRFPELSQRLSGRDVVVLGAGPSAESFLKHRRSQPIVCVDTVYPSLLRAGIVPDAVVTVDAHAWSALHLRRPIDESTILVADIGVSPRHLAETGGVVSMTGGHPLAELLRLAGSPVRRLPIPYTTVTEAAIQIARAAGAASIELQGFDGGYPRAKTYARGTYHYDIFSRSASRRESQESRFAGFVYHRNIPAVGSPPFFPLPGASEIRNRGKQLLEIEFNFQNASAPVASGSSGCPFWIDHREQLRRSLARMKGADSPATPVILAAAGPHGRAHVPVHAALSRRSAPNRASVTDFSDSLRVVDAIVAAELSRYC